MEKVNIKTAEVGKTYEMESACEFLLCEYYEVTKCNLDSSCCDLGCDRTPRIEEIKDGKMYITKLQQEE